LPASYVPDTKYDLHEVVVQDLKLPREAPLGGARVGWVDYKQIQESNLPVCKEGLGEYPATYEAAVNQDGTPCTEGVMTENTYEESTEVDCYVALGGPLGCTFENLKSSWIAGGYAVVGGNLEQYNFHTGTKIIIKSTPAKVGHDFTDSDIFELEGALTDTYNGKKIKPYTEFSIPVDTGLQKDLTQKDVMNEFVNAEGATYYTRLPAVIAKQIGEYRICLGAPLEDIVPPNNDFTEDQLRFLRTSYVSDDVFVADVTSYASEDQAVERDIPRGSYMVDVLRGTTNEYCGGACDMWVFVEDANEDGNWDLEKTTEFPFPFYKTYWGCYNLERDYDPESLTCGTTELWGSTKRVVSTEDHNGYIPIAPETKEFLRDNGREHPFEVWDEKTEDDKCSLTYECLPTQGSFSPIYIPGDITCKANWCTDQISDYNHQRGPLVETNLPDASAKNIQGFCIAADYEGVDYRVTDKEGCIEKCRGCKDCESDVQMIQTQSINVESNINETADDNVDVPFDVTFEPPTTSTSVDCCELPIVETTTSTTSINESKYVHTYDICLHHGTQLYDTEIYIGTSTKIAPFESAKINGSTFCYEYKESVLESEFPLEMHLIQDAEDVEGESCNCESPSGVDDPHITTFFGENYEM
tara:strand:+ start:100482 stop:102404 length:1923 start_codon:yes stop_codon:yes gene_type:complete